jgi:hypothetical protein
MKIIFFKRPKTRQFNYRPLYYNPDEEEALERQKLKDALSSSDPAERMRAQIRRRWRTDQKEQASGINIVRIFIYIAFAAFMVYFLFFTNIVDKLVSLFLR